MWAVVWLIAAHLHILARRLEAVAALRVEAVVQAAEGVVHLRLEHRLWPKTVDEDCYTNF